MTKDRMKSLLAASTALWFLLVFAAPLFAAERWQQVEHPSLDLLFTAVETVPIEYKQVVLEPVSVWYPDSMAADRSNRLRTQATNHLQSAFEERGLPLVTDLSPGTLLVRVQFIDLSATPVSPEVLRWAASFRFPVEPGRVTMVSELVDAATGDVLVRMADLQDSLASAADAAANIDAALASWGDIVASTIALPRDTVAIASR